MLHFVVPGPLDQRTGGYLYDAQMVTGLRSLGWNVHIHSLSGRFPGPDDEAEHSLESVLADLPEGALGIVDGLALGGLPAPPGRHAARLRLLALVHHPLCDESGLSPERRESLRVLEERALAACRGIIVSSPFTARRLESWLGSGIRVVPVIPGTERAARAHGPADGKPPFLLTVGSVVPRKGHDVLVSALEALRGREWEWVAAGSLERDQAYSGAVRARVHAAGLDGRVRFVGECSSGQLEALYDSASLFVLPSWYEGYGMALTEAMARGLPVVSTTGGAIPDTVPPGAGLLVPPGDADALAAALAQLLDDSRLRERLAASAWQHARTLPDWDSAAGSFAAALHTLGET